MDLNLIRRAPDLTEELRFLDRPGEALAKVVAAVLPAGRVKDALSGTWLGHPLHPLLTDLPIGFWTSAWVLDIVGSRAMRPAAQRLVALGVLSALPTAASGASDWADTGGRPRRVGLVHAAANTVALVSYAASWQARRKGRHASGVALGMVGAAAATAGGALGGHLAYALGIGVDNTVFDDAALDEGSDSEGWATPGNDVFVHRSSAGVHALANRCTHRGAPLDEGTVDDGCVECPWHASRFRLTDGEVQQGPATRPQPVFETRVTDAGEVEVRRLA